METPNNWPKMSADEKLKWINENFPEE